MKLGLPPKNHTRFVVSSQSEEAIAAAKFAVAEHSKLKPQLILKSITSAKAQIVAGTNMEMVLEVIDGGQSKMALVVVYTDLSQSKTLTSWVWL